MFSTMPKTGTFKAGNLNKAIPFRASAKATVCGVLTITAPVIGIVLHNVI